LTVTQPNGDLTSVKCRLIIRIWQGREGLLACRAVFRHERREITGMHSKVRRRLFHIGACSAIALAASFLPRETLLPSLGTVTLLFLAFEFTRLRVPGVNGWFFSCFGSLLRKEEAVRVTTSSYVLVAALAVYLAFGKDITVASLAFLAIGDVVAGVVGERMGRTPLSGKALEGHLACLASCVVIGLVLRSAGLDIGLAVILAGALGATAGQAVPHPVDDNLTLPLLAGVAMAAMPP